MGIGLFLPMHPARATELALTPESSDHPIEGLSFDDNDHGQLFIQNVGDRAHYYAIIQGIYARKNWTLIVGRIKVPRDADGHFKVKTELRGPQKNLTLASIGPDGQIEFETIRIDYPGFPIEKRAPRNNFALGLGYTHMWYTQEPSSFSNAVNYSENTITLKGSYLFRLAPPHWDLGLSAFISTLTFGPSIEGTTVRSLGLNARVGYNIPLGHSSWTFSIMGGFYYTTMFVSPSVFGFQNLAGAQLFPVIRTTLPNQDSISAYFKYSPVSAGSISFQPSSREIAGGLTYSFLLANGHSIPLSLDISNLVATAQQISSNGSSTQSVGVSLTTASLSLGYTF